MENTTNTYVLPKSLTGIAGMDDITGGGLPKGRATLLLGNTGCGKTVLAMEFIVNGIALYDEPGVFLTFEENIGELIDNMKSMGYDLDAFIKEGKLYMENIQILHQATEQTEKGSIEGFFSRIVDAIDKVKAKRIVLDSLDSLFYGFNYTILRSEFKKLVAVMKEKKVTSSISGETGEAYLSRRGLEEFVADCVINLENRVTEQATTRFMRIIKYRGTIHGNSEYPFSIDNHGITLLPMMNAPLSEAISSRTLSTGIADLDVMLGKGGVFVGSSTLISGTAGTGKTSIAASLAHRACQEGNNCIFCAFEETPEQVIRNMESIGIYLEADVKSGRLFFYSSRPTIQNIELHFINIKKMIEEKGSRVVILDPITNLTSTGPNSGIRLLLTRFVDFLKGQQITVIFTAAITEKLIESNLSDEGISSMVDTWIMLEDPAWESERMLTCTVMKSRGMNHSKKVKEIVFGNEGIMLKEVREEYH